MASFFNGLRGGLMRYPAFCFSAVVCSLSLSLVVLLLPIAAPPLQAQEYGGPAFSDPTQTFAMPEAWREKSVRPPEAAGEAALAVTLDQQLYAILRPLIDQYARKQGVRIDVQRGTCGISAGKLSRKEVDVAGFCCPPEYADRLPGLEYHTLAIAPLALLVHPKNPVTDVTLTQARQLFSGTIRHWRQLPGGREWQHGPAVRPVVRLHCKRRPGHWRLLLDRDLFFSQNALHVATIPDMLDQVAATPGAVGFSTPYFINQLGRQGRVKMLRINGARATDREALATLRYPLYRTFNLAIWKMANERVKASRRLLDYLLEHIAARGRDFHLVPVQELRQRGWRFVDDELVGEPL